MIIANLITIVIGTVPIWVPALFFVWTADYITALLYFGTFLPIFLLLTVLWC